MFKLLVTFHFGLRSSERRLLLPVAKILQAPVGIFQEGLRGPARQGASLQEGLLLLLVFVDELQDEGNPVVVGVIQA